MTETHVTLPRVNRFGDRSPQEYENLRKDVAAFGAAYVAYLDDTLEVILQGATPTYDARRREVQRLAERADRAAVVAGVSLSWGRPVDPQRRLVGIGQVALAHEDPERRNDGYGVGPLGLSSYDYVIDALGRADGRLALAADEGRRDRRRLFYWPDRFLRAILGFPAYLLSLVFGFDRRELPETQSRVLWVCSVISTVMAVLGTGRALGWW